MPLGRGSIETGFFSPAFTSTDCRRLESRRSHLDRVLPGLIGRSAPTGRRYLLIVDPHLKPLTLGLIGCERPGSLTERLEL
jgi:hypothetical protein